MDRQEVLDGLAEVVAANFPKYRQMLGPETQFSEIQGWDSVAHVAFMLDVEDKFGIAIPEEDFFSLVDVPSLSAHVLASANG